MNHPVLVFTDCCGQIVPPFTRMGRCALIVANFIKGGYPNHMIGLETVCPICACSVWRDPLKRQR